jgi:hypothetical protein
MKGLIVGVLCALALTGCSTMGAGPQYYSATYKTVPKSVVDGPGGKWDVQDLPDQGKIVTTPSGDRQFGIGFASGLTLGLAHLDPGVLDHEAVASTYLASTGRTCELIHSTEIIRPAFETTYECK